MKNLIVFGASGGTGRALVAQALQAGHRVTAFVRQSTAFTTQDRLRLVVGDVMDAGTVSKALEGQEAVLSALGSAQPAVPVCEEGTRNILSGMQAHGVERLVALSAYGASESRNAGLYSRLVWRMLKAKMEDKERVEELIQASPLDWTLVRPTALTDGPARGRYRLGAALPVNVASRISRSDVAAAMLGLLTREARHQALTVTG